MKLPQQLYKGVFNYSCEMIIKYAYAPSPASAKTRMINQLAKEHDVHPSHVFGIFDGSKDNYRIEIDREWGEKHESKDR